MRPIAADGVAWSVGLSVCLSVCSWRQWAPQNRLKWSRCRLGYGSGCAQGTMYLMVVQIPHGNGRCWWDEVGIFPHAAEHVACDTTSEFPRMLLTVVPIGRPQRQSSVKLNFSNESPLHASSRQNCSTTCLNFVFWLLCAVSTATE